MLEMQEINSITKKNRLKLEAGFIVMQCSFILTST